MRAYGDIKWFLPQMNGRIKGNLRKIFETYDTAFFSLTVQAIAIEKV